MWCFYNRRNYQDFKYEVPFHLARPDMPDSRPKINDYQTIAIEISGLQFQGVIVMAFPLQ